jgi:drug/metabolite transporter (DMT)-like permease
VWLVRGLLALSRILPDDPPSWIGRIVGFAVIGTPICLITHYVGGRTDPGPQNWPTSIAVGVGVGAVGMFLVEGILRRERE